MATRAIAHGSAWVKTRRRTSGFPKQIAYIVGNEACERFSYYGMRSILVVFMTQHLLMEGHHAKGIYHLFMTGNYFLPLFGGYLADRYLGKYKTILWLSIVYCIGHGVLACFENEMGMYCGLFLIALGAGGIKPCISSFVGDQFDSSNSHLVTRVYDLFYFSVNFGAFFSTLLIPWVLPKYGPSVAFGIPGVLMAIATLVFVMGSRHYVNVAPTGNDSSQFFSILTYALKRFRQRRAKASSWLDVASKKYGKEKVEGVKSALGVFSVFISVVAFWALYDQTGSSWVLQAKQMDLNIFGMAVEASQVQAINPILIMVLIPLFTFGIYPLVEKMGVRVSPLRKIGAGMFITGLSFLMVGIIQVFLDSGTKLNILWQFPPFFIITSAEVMISITGLEFAYTQAPKTMKGVIMSFWLLTVAGGNFLTAVISEVNPFKSGAMEFFFYGALVFVVSFMFVAIARNYQERSYLATE